MRFAFWHRQHVVTGLLSIAIAVAYYGAGRIALLPQLGVGTNRLVWPQVGLALAALIIFGPEVWPGVVVGSFILTLGIFHAPLPALALAAGTTLGVVVAYGILHRAGFSLRLEHLRDSVMLAMAAIVATFLTGVVNASVIVSTGIRPGETILSRGLHVWMSAATGVLVFTPFLLVLRRLRWPRHVEPKRALEVAGLIACSVATVYFATTATSALLFLAFPVIIWAAVRFELPAAAPCVVLFSLMAVYAAARDLGPFGPSDLSSDVITVQAFNSATALTALVLAVTITERNQAHRDIKLTAGQLANLVDQLDHRLRPNPTGQPRPPLETTIRPPS